MNAALFSEAGQFRNSSAVFDKSQLLEVAKCPTTNYFTANGKKFPFFFRQRVKLLVRFTLRLRVSSNADSENVSEASARWLPLYRIRISS